VLAGSYEETGDRGRIRVRPGDMLIHGAFDSHLNRFPAAGARILNLTVPDGVEPETGLACPVDPDAALRLAERDPAAAAALLLTGATARSPAICDWPDMLAEALLHDPALGIGDWARAYGLAEATVSRGFRQVYGISPSAFRAELRARTAWRRIADRRQHLADLAFELGFADQAHMSRAVRAMTGLPPSAWQPQVK